MTYIASFTTHESVFSIKAYLIYNLTRIQLEQRDQRLAKDAARRVVALARATRLAIKTKERSLSARITEVEEYIGLLRQKRALIQNRGAEADEQMGMALNVLHQLGITEQAMSSCENGEDSAQCDINFHDDCFHPPSSNFIDSDGILSDTHPSEFSDSDSESDSPLHMNYHNTIDHHIIDIGRPSILSEFVDSGHGGSVAEGSLRRGCLSDSKVST